MNRFLSTALLASLLAGCSTAYRSGQTPDDVYFSPSAPRVARQEEYVAMNDRDGYNRDGYNDVDMSDRYLRMKSSGRSRWSQFDDDYTYWNNPYWNNRSYFDLYPSISFGSRFSPFGFNSPFASPFGYNSFGLGYNSFGFGYGYSPYMNPFSPIYYGQPVIVYNNYYNNKNYVLPKSNGPRTYSIGNYAPGRSGYSIPKNSGNSLRSGGQYYETPSSGTPRGGYNPRSGGNSSSGNPVRTFSNSSNNSSSSSSSSSSSNRSSGSSSGSSAAPVRSFPRGGN